MEKDLHFIGESWPHSFGCSVQNDEAYKRMRRHLVPLPEKERTRRCQKYGACRGVEVKYLAPVLGRAAWQITERRDFDLFQVGDTEEFFKIIYNND